jgi:polar amino acid transport system permease protein
VVADGLKFAALVAVLSGLMIHATQGMGYHWQWYRIPAYIVAATPTGIVFGPLLRGLGVTLQIAPQASGWPS